MFYADPSGGDSWGVSGGRHFGTYGDTGSAIYWGGDDSFQNNGLHAYEFESFGNNLEAALGSLGFFPDTNGDNNSKFKFLSIDLNHGLSDDEFDQALDGPLIGGKYAGNSFDEIKPYSTSASGFSQVLTKSSVTHDQFETYFNSLIGGYQGLAKFYGIEASIAGGSALDLKSLEDFQTFMKEFKKLVKKGKIPKSIKSANPLSLTIGTIFGIRGDQFSKVAEELYDLKSKYHDLHAKEDSIGKGIYIISEQYSVGTMGGQGWINSTYYYDVRTRKLLKTVYERY